MATWSAIMTSGWLSTRTLNPKPINAANWFLCAGKWMASCLKWAGRTEIFRKPFTGRASLPPTAGWIFGMFPPRPCRTKPIGRPARSLTSMPARGTPRPHPRPSALCATGLTPQTSSGFPPRNSAAGRRTKRIPNVTSRLLKPMPPTAHAWRIRKRRLAAA